MIIFAIGIWIIVPAPSGLFWLVAIVAGEWSLWLAITAFLIISASLYFLIFAGGEKLWLVSLSLSLFVLCISLYPLTSVLKLAKSEHISLSVGEYFSGLSFNNSTPDFTTHTFASVDGKDLQLDYFAPRIVNENNGAAVIVVHGGGWNGRTRNDFPQWNEWLAADGYAVFDIDYRLAPQPNYLTATGDVKCAVLWIKEHAAEFKISPDRIALFGRSAGAHLSLLAAYSAGDSRLPPSCRSNIQNENVRAVISFYAPIELLWAYDNPANQRVLDGPQTIADFIGGNPHESDELRQRIELASPLTHISDQTPPTLLVHGGFDQIVREENMKFADEKLSERNIPHKTIYIPSAQHGFDYNFHGFGSQITKSAMLAFLRENTN